MDISVRVDVRELTRNLGALADRQIPFATAQALNDLGRIIKAGETENLKKTFPTLTPFTANSVAVLKARKDNPTVVILIKDRAAHYLDPYEVGGRRVLNSRALLNPKAVNLNQYGNIPKGRLAALRARADVFIGPVKRDGRSVSGVWQRIPARKGQPAKLKLLIRFGDALPVRQRLHYQSKGTALVAAHFRQCFQDAMARAMATAR